MDKEENENPRKLNGGEYAQSYRLDDGNQGRESSVWNGLRSISPTLSLSSSDNCISSCSDISINVNSFGRCSQEEGSSDDSQEDINFHPNGYLRNLGSSSLVNGIHRSDKQENSNDKVNLSVCRKFGDGDGDEENIGTSDAEHEDIDGQFWFPPEPEDEDDNVGCLTNYDDDDDDECGDGMKWGKPSCLGIAGEEGHGGSMLKEEKQKMMDNVMNGKFKTLVAQLLKSVDVAFMEDGESWVDIVTSLSWEAASFVKPDVIEGKGMGPDGCIKVKCVATGTRSQSQVVKGLVFKKNASLKRMPTKYEKPKLLLIQGELGPLSSGLSSLELMKQENDSMNSVVEMIEMCHPNVILVEKTVSRYIQESILAKGMTLVSDMKSHRLERIARCTGSQILSSNMLIGQKLRRCNSFRIEKFEEEHAALGEGRKKPRKTLLFIEGCPTQMGCTILLMGAHTDELKRIKCVVQCAVVMAYHLILETSFILDQRAMFSVVPLNGVTSLSLSCQETPFITTYNSSYEMSHANTKTSCATSTPICNGFNEGETVFQNLALKDDAALPYEPYNPIVFPGLSSLSTSLKKVIGDSFPLFSSTSRQSMSTYFGLDEGRSHNDKIQSAGQVSSSVEAFNHSTLEEKGSSDQDKAFGCIQHHSSSDACKENFVLQDSSASNEERRENKDDINRVLDSESILVLMSSRNASRGTICEHCHFSRIKFYRNFDVPLGKFLRDNLLSQRLQCNTCNEPPEAHFYYYAHHNKQLTIQVRSLPHEKQLPGESEDKLWMWSRCGRCKPCGGNFRSTKRVLISTAARGLSFGKFLELNFSDQSSFSKPSGCGHSFNRDFLYFFGLGQMVAMFRYTRVSTYSVSLPPQKLESRNSIKAAFLEKDLKNVYTKGILMFEDVAKALKKIGPQFVGSILNLHGSVKEISDIENMLSEERDKFEVSIHDIIKNGKEDNAAYKLLSLNRLRWDLLLESCVWDRRLQFLQSSDTAVQDKIDSVETGEEFCCQKVDDTAGKDTNGVEITINGDDDDSAHNSDMSSRPEVPVQTADFLPKEIPVEDSSHFSGEQDKQFSSDDMANSTLTSTSQRMGENESSTEEIGLRTELSDNSHAVGENIDFNISRRSKSQFSFSLSNLENGKEWLWTPFPQIQYEYMKDLQRGYVPKFECICHYSKDTMIQKLIAEEGPRLYVPLGISDFVVSDYDDELSSVVACALVLLKDIPLATESLDEFLRKEKGLDTFCSFSRSGSLPIPHWPSVGSQDSNGTHLPQSLSAEELHLSSFDGSSLLDSLVSMGALHPEVSLGLGKSTGKRKYSVVFLYADLFRNLRERCCSSELDYIASLSRCRNWDAKGGKSKSFFAKTLDDRFIIKEIKRTEFDSFVKFAPEYFKYMNQCFDIGNQTCLAKILGIYQIRLAKNGKEMKHDLMVMENLSFNRNMIRQYDLKGALHARFNSSADGPGDVLLDQNFVNDMNASPLYVSTKAMRNLQRAVWNDTTFLNSINVMDYSLLVGVDSQRRELVCGIIDYLRQYTWDKQLENWVKSSLVVPKNQLPTIISPKEYKKRFRKFIHNHFLSVPDNWCSQRSSNPCRLCGLGEQVDVSHGKPQKHEENHDSSHMRSEGQE